MSNYLVTGGAGFIGSHLVEALLAAGHQVRVLDDFSTGKRQNLAGTAARLEVIEGDIRDPAAVAKAVQGVEYVLHQAALPSVPRSVKDPATSHAVNATGTLNLLLAAREAGVRRVVYAASSSAYGDSPALPKREDMATQPKSPYAVSKLMGEHYCSAFGECYGLETVCLRYFNVFGPRQDLTSQYAAVIPLFITALLEGDEVPVHGDGGQTRDFTYVANVVEANLLAATAPGAAGALCNIACGERTSLMELIALLAELTGCTPRIRHDPPRAGDVRDSLADITAARTRLGYTARVSLREGLKETVAWFKEAARG